MQQVGFWSKVGGEGEYTWGEICRDENPGDKAGKKKAGEMLSHRVPIENSAEGWRLATLVSAIYVILF